MKRYGVQKPGGWPSAWWRQAAPSTHGFTLVELLVVITIIGLLVALLLPAVQSVRQTALQTECLNNIRQFGLAMQSFESTKGRLPGYSQAVRRSNQRFATIGGGGELVGSVIGNTEDVDLSNRQAVEQQRRRSRISWIGVLLPQLDQQAIWDNIVDGDVDGIAVPTDQRAAVRPIEFFTCPADTDLTTLVGAAGTSYSANTGCWDLENEVQIVPAEDQRGDVPANGVLQNLVLQPRLMIRSSAFRDGASTTLLLAENRHKAAGDVPGAGYSWLGVTAADAAAPLFGEQQLGLVWVPNSTNPIAMTANELTNDNQQAPLSNEELTPGNFFPTRPAYARPDSAHQGGVFNAVFADASGKSIAPDIDYTVYQRLLTSNGREAVDPRNQTDLTEIQNFRRLAPLVEADFQQ